MYWYAATTRRASDEWSSGPGPAAATRRLRRHRPVHPRGRVRRTGGDCPRAVVRSRDGDGVVVPRARDRPPRGRLANGETAGRRLATPPRRRRGGGRRRRAAP